MKISRSLHYKKTKKVFEHVPGSIQKCLNTFPAQYNNFFSEVGKSLSTKIKPSPTTYRHFITHTNPKNSLFLAPTDAYEIQLLIKNLKMKLNSSPNDIPSKFLKIASCIVSEWLSKLFNKCMTTGEFPDSWKIARITPIPKVHSPSSSSVIWCK